MADILTTIVEKRKADIERLGVTFGFTIPEERSRPVHSFLTEKGVILEVKRASPSKGDIAPELESGATARSYAEAGARAISCLTETNYFKGTLAVSGKIRDLSGKVTITAKHQYKDPADSQFKDFENNAANKPTSLTINPITSAALKTDAGADWSDEITLPAVTGTYRIIYTAENAYKQTEIKKDAFFQTIGFAY